MVISEDPLYTHTCCRAFRSGAVPICFNDLGFSWLGFEHPTLRMRGECSNRQRLQVVLAKHRYLMAVLIYKNSQSFNVKEYITYLGSTSDEKHLRLFFGLPLS